MSAAGFEPARRLVVALASVSVELFPPVGLPILVTGSGQLRTSVPYF